MENNNSFTYTYSAPLQEEVRRIKSKYEEKSEETNGEISKIDLLRKLDKNVTQTGTVIALSLGIIGTLIMGTGMSLVMVWNEIIIGCIVGIVGISMIVAAYPSYLKTIEIKRKELAPKIISLADELLEK